MSERPWRSGKFTISAGLKPLDNKPVFLVEEDEEKYLLNKLACRRESLNKHYPLPFELTLEEMEAAAHKIRNLITHKEIKRVPEARDQIDEVISQVPEDFAIWKMDHDQEWLALIHLSSPNHWDAREKIGKSFFESHKPIPHIDPISKAAPKIFEQIQKRGSVERYAWGVATDDRLNHHPEAPPGITPEEWKGRSFDIFNPKLFIRMERQTLFPITDKTIGFTIKTSFTDVASLPAEDLILISQCISGMDHDVLKYKGLIQDRESILNWISSLVQIAERHPGMSFASSSP